MPKFEFSGNDLIIRWEIRGFQLFDYLEKGLLQPYDATTGNMIIDRNTDHGKKIMESFKRTPPLTVEKQEKKQRANQIKYYGFVHSGREAKRKAQALYNYHIVRLNDCIQKTFTLSRDEKEAVKQIREAKKWVFKTDDVLRFEQDHGSYKKSVLTDDYDAIIRDFKLSYENDSNVNIQQRRAKAVSYHCTTLGFKNEQGKEWRDFIQILQEPEHIYYVGVPYIGDGKQSNKQYSRRQKRKIRISEKLTDFFNKHFLLHLPSNFNFFELFQNEKPGTYKLKCPVINADNDKSIFDSWMADELIAEYERLVEENRKREDVGTQDRLQEAAKVLLAKEYLTSKEIKDIIEPPKEEFQYKPHENEPDTPPNF